MDVTRKPGLDRRSFLAGSTAVLAAGRGLQGRKRASQEKKRDYRIVFNDDSFAPILMSESLEHFLELAVDRFPGHPGGCPLLERHLQRRAALPFGGRGDGWRPSGRLRIGRLLPVVPAPSEDHRPAARLSPGPERSGSIAGSGFLRLVADERLSREPGLEIDGHPQPVPEGASPVPVGRCGPPRLQHRASISPMPPSGSAATGSSKSWRRATSPTASSWTFCGIRPTSSRMRPIATGISSPAWSAGSGRCWIGSGKETGRKVRLAVRVATPMEISLGMGLDVETWIREGLPDLVIAATPRGFELSLPLEQYVEAVRNRPITLLAQMGWHQPVKEARGAALNFWDQGVHGIYLFNWYSRKDRHHESLREIGDPGLLRRRDKVYPVHSQEGDLWADTHPSGPTSLALGTRASGGRGGRPAQDRGRSGRGRRRRSSPERPAANAVQEASFRRQGGSGAERCRPGA